MKYKDCISWLYSFEKFGVKLGLERIQHICSKLDNPQKNYDIIHVGGTNGKGSVCRFIQSVLTLSGYKVGVYTSPHLHRFSERFVIDGKEISDSNVVKLVEKIKPIVDEMIKEDDTPTFFEIVTAMAFLYFSNEKVDYAVIEVGLGGRFDATNIVKPVLSIITNVSLEHQDRLGEKIEDIAFEKAGIIKENIPVVTGARDESLEVIKKIEDEKNTKLTIVDKKLWKKTGSGVNWQEFLIHGSLKDYHIKTQLPGVFQAENIAVSIAAIETLQINGVYITDDSIVEGFEKTKSPGRMEIAGFEPLILLDSAHNIAGIQALKDTIMQDFVYEKLILVFGVLSDKNIQQMIDIILPLADTIIFTKSSNKRALNPSKLKEMIDCKCVVENNISDAIIYAKKTAEKKDLICISGSIFTVGDARKHLGL